MSYFVLMDFKIPSNFVLSFIAMKSIHFQGNLRPQQKLPEKWNHFSRSTCLLAFNFNANKFIFFSFYFLIFNWDDSGKSHPRRTHIPASFPFRSYYPMKMIWIFPVRSSPFFPPPYRHHWDCIFSLSFLLTHRQWRRRHSSFLLLHHHFPFVRNTYSF